LPPRITVKSDVGESEIVRTIKQMDADGRVVIVDLEGVASRLVSRAISQADLVLTPMRATTLDATIGVRALALIQEEEEALGRAIRHAVVFTMTRAIKSKQHTAIEASLKKQGVDVITPPLMERAAFSALFEFGGDLRSMPAQGKMEPAAENAAGFAEAVLKRLTGNGKRATNPRSVLTLPASKPAARTYRRKAKTGLTRQANSTDLLPESQPGSGAERLALGQVRFMPRCCRTCRMKSPRKPAGGAFSRALLSRKPGRCT
jgi:chromosome partitioning protein